MEKTFLSWSSGKDAALALYYLQKNERYQVDRLFTSINTSTDRVSMQGTRQSLLEKQIEHIALSSTIVELPGQVGMDAYNRIMKEEVNKLREAGYTQAAFGDIFLEDLKEYREQQLNALGIKTVFPLWQKDTTELVHAFLDLGFKAMITVIRADILDRSFLGKTLDKQLFNDLPVGVDPCGENGEFHTFCYDGPIFQNPVQFEFGKQYYKEYNAPNAAKSKKIGYWFQDLISDEKNSIS